MKDLYIVQKHIMAESVEDALKAEKKYKVSQVFVDSDWLKHKIEKVIDTKIYNK